MTNRDLILSDCSLRDGNHFVKHQISLSQIKQYCLFANDSGIPIVEVGHGLGLGASSLLMGQTPHSDAEMLKVARESLRESKLGVHIVPGIATIKRDVIPAIDIGVDIFRVGSHCTEANITRSHIEFLRNEGKNVYGVLMMTALTDAETLVSEAKKMEQYGAMAVMIMDSTGTYTPEDVRERIGKLKDNLSVDIGFHAHNNLGLSIANSLIAAQSGATIIDGCIRGFGAGAGNSQIELLVAVFDRYGFKTNIDLDKVIIEADKVMQYLVPTSPTIAPINILTGLYKLFCGFEKPILEASKLYGIDYISLIYELKNRKLVAGQEDLIINAAQNLRDRKNTI